MDNTSDGACCRRLDVLEELFSRPCIRRAALTPNHDGQTFLFYMAEWGGLTYGGCEAFDAIIQAAQEPGVDVNHQADGKGQNCLLTSQPTDYHLTVCARLLPAAACHNGDTVLHVAMRATGKLRRRRDDASFIQRWIEAGARPRQVDGLRQPDSLVLLWAVRTVTWLDTCAECYCCSINNTKGLRAFDIPEDRARHLCQWSLNVLRWAEAEQATPPQETRSQRYLRRCRGEPGWGLSALQ